MKMKKILLLDYTSEKSYKHEYLPIARETVKKLGQTSGAFETLATDDCSVMNGERLSEFSALLFTTSGDLPLNDRQKNILLRSVRDGGGFVGVHNATLTFPSFTEFGEMLGGYFNSHPWTQEIAVIVEDNIHPASRHLPKTFKVKEEVYEHKDWIGREKTHVLMRLDNDSVDLSKGHRTDNDYALCWCHSYGKGRVFYTAFGHFIELWKEKWYQKHLLNGILWAMKQID